MNISGILLILFSFFALVYESLMELIDNLCFLFLIIIDVVIVKWVIAADNDIFGQKRSFFMTNFAKIWDFL